MESGTRRRREQHRTPGWAVIMLVALVAYSGLWLSERIGAARTAHALLRSSSTACGRAAGETPWLAARRSAPSGDPRRVLAMTERAQRADGRASNRNALNGAMETAARASQDAGFLATGPGP